MGHCRKGLDEGAEKLAEPDLAELIDVYTCAKKASRCLVRISGHLNKASGLLKPKTIFDSESLNEVDGHKAIFDELLEANAQVDMEELFYNIYEMNLAVALMKEGAVFHTNITELKLAINTANHSASVAGNAVKRLMLLPWWNKPQSGAKFGDTYEFKMQVIYCGLAEACNMIAKLVKELRKFNDKVNPVSFDLLTLVPPAVSSEAREHYSVYFPERKKAKQRIISKIASMNLGKLGIQVSADDLEF